MDPGQTDLMDVGWVKQVREDNEETKKPRKAYQHGESCLYGSDPTSIVQGRGIEGIFWKRCDGRYLNAFGEELRLDELMEDDSVPVSLVFDTETDESKLAEMAWKRHHPEDSDEEEEVVPKRNYRCIVM